MASFLVLAFILLVGPLSYFYGVDSRFSDKRGWFPARARRRR